MDDREKKLIELLTIKFGKKNSDKITSLITSLSLEDPLILENKTRYISIFLSLPATKLQYTLNLINILSKVNRFAGAFFIEKISCLLFFDIFDQISLFLLSIKDYGARTLAYYLGSDNLKNDDLEDVLNEVDLKYYLLLLKKIQKNHTKLQILSSHVLRYARELNEVLAPQEISFYIEVCIKLYKKYGTDTAFLFIENSNQILKKVKLKQIENTLLKLYNISKEYMDYCLKNFILIKNPKKALMAESSKRIMLNILNQNDLTIVNRYPSVLKNKYFNALISNWPRYRQFHKKNILDQINSINFKERFQKEKKIKAKVSLVSSVTNNHWFDDWYYTSKEVNNKQIYDEIKNMLIPNSYFSFKTRKIFALNRNLFTSIKKDYKTLDILKLISYLQNICINKNILNKLISFEKYLKNNKLELIKTYSEKDLLIKTWDRDPWIDYARSDELYSCTSIGKSADIYAPLYLADININNLDIWNNATRIGRIHLLLIKNEKNIPMLLIDSIEGSDRFMRNEKRLNYILNAILQYARYQNIENVLFNCDLTFNNTPKLFIKFLHSKYNKAESIFIKRFIPYSTLKELLPHPLNSFVETLKNREEGLASGFLVSS